MEEETSPSEELLDDILDEMREQGLSPRSRIQDLIDGLEDEISEECGDDDEA
jgi:hypothetical protein